MYKPNQTDQRVKPFFKLVLWLVLGRGSLSCPSNTSTYYDALYVKVMKTRNQRKTPKGEKKKKKLL